MPRSWYPKLAVCIAAAVVIAAGLLSLRQARLQAAHELTRARLRLIKVDDALLSARGEIATLASPAVLAEGPLSDREIWRSHLDVDVELEGLTGGER